MSEKKQSMFSRLKATTIRAERVFSAEKSVVWRAWTEPEMLDQWWAPRPYKAITTHWEFRPGGLWRYNMVGPENDIQYCKAEFTEIAQEVFFRGTDGFCDEHGTTIADMPLMYWDVRFIEMGEGTMVSIDIGFDSSEGLEKILELGFQEGFSMAHGNLDELLNGNGTGKTC